ncbi:MULTISPECIES: 30S ribosomal protein S20 [Virgibacillus]|uniref:Small ribosomal subunit protein bS20 n=1 Tax=Virgibacillus halodenitrificans TaxID=1482 RepID=A0AAC9J0A3_VIRHA|nr:MULTISPECIES: 30S ribosomal protein S20 [Virgibacillus]AIF43375.1 30S ribosomal protein S20 [Virgibacillus sp. SK37]APC48207.1 30S ribosomal protein S20 [Virgibacillus halodenitrificans]MCG1029207.1 30S ribosomal protein S20 [Virgibacillus halodenitrificans]MEC2160038.1 30S ribosomal protein S20 [Virgibacillus halodenitrificans]MYL46636.1 30S ribosomal protein S20 [Virgibacillus halodenitrificans]
MANIKSAIKRVDVNNKKHANNQAQKSAMRSEIKRVEKLVEANDAENAKSAFRSTAKHIDKAVQKGIIHKNNGDRQKSRLAKKVNSLGA